MNNTDFNGEKYRRASTHQKEWGNRIIAGLNPAEDARILDLGCGDGALTAQLAELVPQGSVLGIDSSASMIQMAKRHEGDRLRFALLDMREMAFASEFDLVFSNAALHWVLDHGDLLERVYRALKTGGRIRFNFAGAGNCANFYAVVKAAMAELRFTPYFHDFVWPWYMPEAREYEELVERSPFAGARVWGENADRYFADAAAMTRWIEQPSLVPFLGALPEEAGRAFRDEVVGRMIERTMEVDGRCFETFRRINVEAGK